MSRTYRSPTILDSSTFTALSPGVFHVTISAKGFADWTATDIVLKWGQDYELADITLINSVLLR